MHIKRHDSTVRKILKALQRRTYSGGSYCTILDACKAAELVALGAAAKRLPRWLLPAAPTETELARALTNKDQYTVQVVEVGYCSDYSWRDKVQAKLEQHAALVGKLREEGWKVDEALHVIVVGAKGAVFLSAQQALQRLGLDKYCVMYCVTPVCVLRENHRARRSCDRGRREEVGEMPLMKRGERGETIASRGSCMAEGEARLC